MVYQVLIASPTSQARRLIEPNTLLMKCSSLMRMIKMNYQTLITPQTPQIIYSACLNVLITLHVATSVSRCDQKAKQSVSHTTHTQSTEIHRSRPKESALRDKHPYSYSSTADRKDEGMFIKQIKKEHSVRGRERLQKNATQTPQDINDHSRYTPNTNTKVKGKQNIKISEQNRDCYNIP